MKSNELKKVAQGYVKCLPKFWLPSRNEFVRSEGDWVQIISFNASRFAEQYVPRSCLEFLKMPGLPTGPFLVQELQNSNGTQRWVKTGDDPVSISKEMSMQFRPSLENPLDTMEIRHLLAVALNYWPNAYALCVTACEEGNSIDATRYFDAFVAATKDKPFLWAETRRQELVECLLKIGSPEALGVHLNRIQADKRRALKLPA